MTPLTNDTGSSVVPTGLLFALVAAASFGVSGSIAKGLMETGWTPGAAVLLRVAIAALVLAIPGVLAMRGRWHVLRGSMGSVIAYGLFAVAGAQLFYFMAVSTLDVGVALLIEYLAPVAVVMWLWLRHGHKPNRLTAVGGVLAALGLVLLLNVTAGGPISIAGIGWALAAMVGATVYFVISGDDSNPLPPIALASGGLMIAAIALAAAAAFGVLPIAFGTGDVVFTTFSVPVWAAVLFLGVVTAAVAYVAGIAATRRLGARVGSFVALSEVVAATAFAWILLGQTPAPIQFGGAALVLLGVVVVKIAERPVAVQVAVEPLMPQPAIA